MPEVVSCPQCERKLRVPDELISKLVKCPTCGTTFTAEVGGAAPPPLSVQPREEPSWREEEDLPPRPSAQPRRREADDYDEDDYDDYPRRPRTVHRVGMAPHRGTLILVLGILGLVVCGLLAPIAWVMGNTDLQEIRAGRMDPEGEATTNAGRICGMIGTILIIVSLVFVCVIFGCARFAGGLGGGRGGRF
jgi:hypothetical protein